MKRRNEIIWIIWNLSRDSQNPQSRSYWRYIPFDIRNLILDEICLNIKRRGTLGIGIRVEEVIKKIWERKMKNLENKPFKLIQKKNEEYIIQ